MTIFYNYYRCDCGNEWTASHMASHSSDECSECGAACSPYKSENTETGETYHDAALAAANLGTG